MGERSATAARPGRGAYEQALRRTRGWLSELARDRPLGAAEVLVVFGCLTIVAVLALGSYVQRGGFYTDDWVQSASTRYPAEGGILGTLHAFDWTRYRPGQYVYFPLIHTLFGLHMKVFLVWAAACAVAMSTAFYAFLRVQGLRALEAGGCAALVLVFPYSSSTRLWATTSVTSVAVTLYLVGTIIVLYALSGRSSRPWLLHAAGVAVVLWGVMTYEVVAPAAVLSVLLYLRVTGRRRAVAAWLVDVVLVGLTLIFVTSGRQQQVGTFGDELSHAWVITQQSLDFWAGVLVPYGAVPTRVALGALVVVAVVAAVVARLSPAGSTVRRDLLRWLVVLGAGVVGIAVAYAMFLPADQYYSPATLGIGDRTNGFAALAWVLVVVAVLRLIVTLALRDIRRSELAVGVALAIAIAAVGLGYADRLRAEADVYAASFHDQQDILGVMHASLPHPPAGSTIYVVRHVAWTGLGVPVFAQWWDLYGAVRITYDDPTLWGYPIVPPASFLGCGSHTAVTTPAAYGGPPRYGHAFVLDMATRQMLPLTDRATCRRVTVATGVAPAA
jgi:hypothetical protein